MLSKISLIVPVYNVEAYLDQCLTSLVNQTMQDIEIVLVEDRSTDSSRSIAEEWSHRDERIHLVCHQKNLGLSAARNTGLQHCHAPYVLFVDSDDYVAPNYCEALYKTITHHEADLAMCGTEIFSEGENRSPDFGHYWDTPGRRDTGCCSLTEHELRETNPCVWNKIYRRDLIVEHQLTFPDGLKHEDEYWWRLYTSYAKTMAWISEKLYYYRQRSNSIMRGVTQDDRLDLIQVAMRFYDEACDRNLEEKKAFALLFFAEALKVQYQRSEQAEEPALLERRIRELAVSFVNSHSLSESDFPKNLKHVYDYAKEGGSSQSGIFHVRRTPTEKIYSLGEGFPLWKWRFKEKKVEGLLLGCLPLWWQRFK